ncbi:hypothetical protein RhiirC2_771185 [Rhizophagus irregularis]|uniref:Uncharacterized protein n=1 Tax=Rhizophagus irregularis TaxID=588596 RepID=A0A2N1NUI4_9GLOM|nr:hypothetical protein RhiirC2_790455 [Rhizophagus irregularis]PKK77567.1 hypothetical protein RhiirC2_771185 [Rhizophagus irregularis]
MTKCIDVEEGILSGPGLQLLGMDFGISYLDTSERKWKNLPSSNIIGALGIDKLDVDTFLIIIAF